MRRLSKNIGAWDAREERAEFFRELSAYYIQTRYPEEIKDLASQAKKEGSQRVLDRTEEVLQWLNSML